MRVRFPIISIITLATVLLSGSCTSKNNITFESLLAEITCREQIINFPEPFYRLKQFSSYDRLSVNPMEDGWFANSDYSRFIREENIDGRREFVMFDHDGPGAVVRWWMTFAGEGSSDGTVRIYLDNSEVPFIESPVLDVVGGKLLAGEPLSSSVSPETEYARRGHNLYLPIPYSKHCKITYECDSIRYDGKRWSPSIYYNINYREYDDEVNISTLDSLSLAGAQDLIKEVNRRLMNPVADMEDDYHTYGNIEPEEAGESTISGGGRAISGIKLKINAGNINQALRSTVLEISFDNNPAVWVPVGDFFGTGFQVNPSETWYSSVGGDTLLTCYWLMPFKQEARVRLINFGMETVKYDLHLLTTKKKWQQNTMYFGASWHEYNRIETAGSELVGGTGNHIDINYIDIEGRGVYAGDAVTVFNTADAWWGEGDEKIYIDNEEFPSSIGTGTEDYYGYAWCRPEKFSHPFIAQPTGEGNFYPGMTVNMRYRVLDAIPFSKGISSNIELWHWVPTVINYALTSYYYVLPGYSVNIVPDENAVRIKVPEGKSDLLNLVQ